MKYTDNNVSLDQYNIKSDMRVLEHIERQQETPEQYRKLQGNNPDHEFIKVFLPEDPTDPDKRGSQLIREYTLEKMEDPKARRVKQQNDVADFSCFTLTILPMTVNEDMKTAKEEFTMAQRKEMANRYKEMIEDVYKGHKVLMLGIHDEKAVDLHIVVSNFNEETKK